MATLLKQSTTVTIRLGPFLDKTTGVDEETAITPVVEVSKNHAAFAARNSATAITHDSNAWFAVELNATDTGTLGPLLVKADDAATYLPVWREFMVVPANVYEAIVAGSRDIPTAVENADALLKRDWTGLTGEASRSALNALRSIRNKWSISGTTITFTKEDDATPAYTAALTEAAGASPYSASDPT